MAGIIDLSDKIAQAKRQQDREKIEAARRIFLCSGCPSKCSKCGTQLDMDDHTCSVKPQWTFRFCSACNEEWEEFQRRKQGKSSSRLYWHNEQWIALWEAWTGYQKAMNEYRKSKEFLQLLEDLNVL